VATTRLEERLLASLGKLQAAPIRFEAVSDVPKGGVWCALPALLALGLLRHSQESFCLPAGYYPLETIFLSVAFLALARVPGVWVPGEPLERPVERQVFADFSDSSPVTRPLVPLLEAIHDRVVLEGARGCTAGCRFCQAGMWYRPVRERPVDAIVEAADEALRQTGCDEVSLMSLSSCDYSDIEEAVRRVGEILDELDLRGKFVSFNDNNGAAVTTYTIKSVINSTTLELTAAADTGFTDRPFVIFENDSGFNFTAENFDVQRTQHIAVQADRTATVNAQLKVGQTTTTVEVEATPLMNAVDTTNGYVMDTAQIDAAPLPTGSFTGLATQSTGVSAELSGGTGANSGLGNAPIWANGQRDTSNSFSVNGLDNNNLFNGKSTSTVGESRFLTSTGAGTAGRSSSDGSHDCPRPSGRSSCWPSNSMRNRRSVSGRRWVSRWKMPIFRINFPARTWSGVSIPCLRNCKDAKPYLCKMSSSHPQCRRKHVTA